MSEDGTSFSTEAVVDLAVNRSTLRSTREQIEEAFGEEAVPVDMRLETSTLRRDGGSAFASGAATAQQLETLESIDERLETIEDVAESGGLSGGGGGSTNIIPVSSGPLRRPSGRGATGVGPIGTASYFATREANRRIGTLPNDLIDQLSGISGSQTAGFGVSLATGAADIGADIAGEFGNELQNIDVSPLTNAAAEFDRTLGDIMSGEPLIGTEPQWVRDLTSNTLREPPWLREFTSGPSLDEPAWLRDLSTITPPEPDWLSDLEDLFNGNGGGSGSGAPQPPRPSWVDDPNTGGLNSQIESLQRSIERQVDDWERRLEDLERAFR